MPYQTVLKLLFGVTLEVVITAIFILISLYFVVKWSVKNGIKEAYKDITGKQTAEDIEIEKHKS